MRVEKKYLQKKERIFFKLYYVYFVRAIKGEAKACFLGGGNLKVKKFPLIDSVDIN